mgnify:FL=1
MSSLERHPLESISRDNPLFGAVRATIETNFYQNNVVDVPDLKTAYALAKNAPGVIELDQPVYEPEKIGLPKDAKVLLFNDGAIVGRYARARVILGDDGVDTAKYATLAREAVFHERKKKQYHAQVVIGQQEDFMVKAHLLIPEGYEHLLYNWMLNFQELTPEIKEMYKNSRSYPEGDIYIVSAPDYQAPGHESGLALFDPEHNCALLCGMRYFGEHKKGTLTLAWSIANRNGFVCCHGGMKKIESNDREYALAVFGLSGSGKSTLTHARHDGKYEIEVLHDDAYIIHEDLGYTIALEPSYFDKTQDYPAGHPANRYLITVQNCGATRNEKGEVTLVAEDIRNGNGRAIKSILWTDNRVQRINEPVDAIGWIMKDEVLPPIVRITDPVLASAFGATLATKRTSAERLAADVDPDSLIIEPYANPFRTYPLGQDYEKFKQLFAKSNVACYVLNTGSFLGKNIPKEVTLGMIEGLVEEEIEFVPMPGIPGLQYAVQEGFEVPDTREYKNRFSKSIQYRINFIENVRYKDRLPMEAENALLMLRLAVDEYEVNPK